MPISTQCLRCRHYKGVQHAECSAFDEIPEEIFTGLFDHTSPWPNADAPQDKGVLFEVNPIFEPKK